jgi:hypothetical protein
MIDINGIASKYNIAFGQGTPSLDVEKRVFQLTAGEIDLLGLFRRTFGYRGIPGGSLSTKTEIYTADAEGFDSTVFSAKQQVIESVMGTPIFQPLKIDGWLFPNEPLITISGTKRLIETPSAGGDQEVIEHISTGHYQIKIQGMLVNMESDDMPQVEIRKIRSLYEANQSLEVESPLLSLFDIRYFAFKTINWPAVEGYQAMQGYEITGRSDKVISIADLKIK